MSLFFTQGHRGVCSKNRLIPGPPGPPVNSEYVNVILDCASDNSAIQSTPLQSLKVGSSYIFLNNSYSTLIFDQTPNLQFYILLTVPFQISDLAFSIFNTNTFTLYELLYSQDPNNKNLFIFTFTDITPGIEYNLFVNGSIN